MSSTFFSLMAEAVNNYVADSVSIAITDLTSVDGNGDADINFGEKWKFRVSVTNRGELNMTGVVLHVIKGDGADVSETVDGSFGIRATLAPFDVGVGDTEKSDFVFLQASGFEKPANTQLARAHIDNWKGDLRHLLDTGELHTGHTEANEASLFGAVVAPSP